MKNQIQRMLAADNLIDSMKNPLLKMLKQHLQRVMSDDQMLRGSYTVSSQATIRQANNISFITWPVKIATLALPVFGAGLTSSKYLGSTINAIKQQYDLEAVLVVLPGSTKVLNLGFAIYDIKNV